jgi:hypothetical protein
MATKPKTQAAPAPAPATPPAVKTTPVVQSTRVITPEGILSFPALFTPRAGPNESKEDAKYSASLVFAPGTDLSGLKKAVMAALVKEFESAEKAAKIVREGSVRLPFRTDVEEKGYEEGSTFVNARSKQRPGVVSNYKGTDGKPIPITDEEQIYPGAIVRASLTAFYYNVNGNKGVSFALNNVQKLRDGERLDGRRKAEDEFDATEDGVADLGDLEPSGSAIDDLM